jgi:hypothetical protein
MPYIPVGSIGPTGATGPQGPIGPSGGPTGPTGPTGPQGTPDGDVIGDYDTSLTVVGLRGNQISATPAPQNLWALVFNGTTNVWGPSPVVNAILAGVGVLVSSNFGATTVNAPITYNGRAMTVTQTSGTTGGTTLADNIIVNALTAGGGVQINTPVGEPTISANIQNNSALINVIQAAGQPTIINDTGDVVNEIISGNGITIDQSHGNVTVNAMTGLPGNYTVEALTNSVVIQTPGYNAILGSPGPVNGTFLAIGFAAVTNGGTGQMSVQPAFSTSQNSMTLDNQIGGSMSLNQGETKTSVIFGILDIDAAIVYFGGAAIIPAPGPSIVWVGGGGPAGISNTGFFLIRLA